MSEDNIHPDAIMAIIRFLLRFELRPQLLLFLNPLGWSFAANKEFHRGHNIYFMGELKILFIGLAIEIQFPISNTPEIVVSSPIDNLTADDLVDNEAAHEVRNGAYVNCPSCHQIVPTHFLDDDKESKH